jgi:hypothetical protein
MGSFRTNGDNSPFAGVFFCHSPDNSKGASFTLDLARIFHEFPPRDRGEGCATGQPQGVGPEAYLNATSQGSTPEDARKDGHIRGRSRQFVKYPGQEEETNGYI